MLEIEENSTRKITGSRKTKERAGTVGQNARCS